MTPQEYLKIKTEQSEIIKAAEAQIEKARRLANKCTIPKNRRPARASDIVEDAIIWHVQPKKYGGNYWNVVDEPLHYGDPFKAYVADDGCRYGLHNAYVEENP